MTLEMTKNSFIQGSWTTDPADPETIRRLGRVTMTFDKDGLTYVVHGNESDQVILLTYRIEGDLLVTDQPSSPREERTRFIFMPDGRLCLIYNNEPTFFVRRLRQASTVEPKSCRRETR